MNILLLDLGRELRGGQRQVYYLERALSGEHHIVTACPAGSGLARLLQDEKLPFLPLPGSSAFSPSVLWAVAKGLAGMDILHTQDAHAAALGALIKALHPGIRLIHHRRVSYPLHPGLRSWKYRMADAIVGVSAEIAAMVVAGGVSPEKVVAIHSGIDPKRYERRRPHGAPFLFQSVGACTPQKGYSVLVAAIRILRDMGAEGAQDGRELPPWRVRIVGDGPLRQSLLEQARDLGVANLLDMPGRMDSRDVLPDSDAMLVPSVDGEGSSGAIKEGWVTGVPVICSALTSNLELVHDEVNGLVAPVGDAGALAEAMRRCLLDAGLRERLVSAGDKSLLNFTDIRMAESNLALYRKLVA